MIPIRDHFPVQKPMKIKTIDLQYPFYSIISDGSDTWIYGYESNMDISEEEYFYEIDCGYEYDSENEGTILAHAVDNKNVRSQTTTSFTMLVEALELVKTTLVDNKSWVFRGNEVSCDSLSRKIIKKNTLSDDAILRFITKHGFISSTLEVLTSEEESDELTEEQTDTLLANTFQSRIVRRPVDYFIGALIPLLVVYLCWCYLEWGERGDVFSLVEQSAADMQIEGRRDSESMDEFFRRVILALHPVALASYEYNGHSLNRVAIATDPSDAMFIQLYDVISSGEVALGGHVISNCANCGCQYMKNHGNSTLCANCKTPKVKSQAHRNRVKARKEARENAEKER